MRLAGWTRPVAGRSAALSITRGARLAKPAPRSGSMTMMRAMLRLASPSSSGSPTCEAERIEQRGVDPDGARRRRLGDVGLVRAGRAAHAQLAAQRIAVAHRLDADQARRAALVVGGAAHAREVGGRRRRQAERARPWPRTRPASAGRSTTIASPPSIWRASRARPPLIRSAKKPTAVSAATASVTATTSRRSSPARKSRSSWRQPSCQTEGGRSACDGAARGERQRCGGRSASSQARNLHES